jgi:mevalonate kinase
MPASVASAPGKAILAGEHAAVWGRPALIAAIGLRLSVEAATVAGTNHQIHLAGTRHDLACDRAHDLAQAAEAAWHRWCMDPGAPLGTKDPLAHIAATLHELGRRLAIDRMPALRLVVTSEIPLGAGLGSSAALAVAVLQAGSAALGHLLEPATLFDASLAVERLQHGRPSGIDNAAVLHGGVCWISRRVAAGTDDQKAGGGDHLEVSAVVAEPKLLSHLALADSGRPHETTGAVVAAVRRLANLNPDVVEAANDRIGAATHRLRDALVAGDGRNLAVAIDDCEQALEDLGVVPPAVRQQLEALGRRGISAKISGAGALSDPGAGAVLAHDPLGHFDPTALGWSPLTTTLGAAGARLEET